MSINMVAVASLATPSITISFANSKTLTSLLSYWSSSNSTLRHHPSSCALTLHCGAAVFVSSSSPFTSPIPIQVSWAEIATSSDNGKLAK
ncbi:hypothetical protein Ahy_B10g106559 [Arachis hypogaea]|uniref:Uncharacterized protein n=1 Tax=Arachis hypogaea TaxID=3818 RepID=A0A444XB78_ARAHY|nr:hypothetical protein Ahy_B10g106559 [Arachis hypogaea]